MLFYLLAAALLPGATPVRGAELGLVPLPAHVERLPGAFRLGPGTVVVADPGARRTAELLQEELRRATGWPFPFARGPARARAIHLRLDPSQPSLGAEGYRMSVTPRGVHITAAGAAGVFYAVQTLRQLLPSALLSKTPPAKGSWTLPCVKIEDAPRFSWRGSHLDVGRHFMPRDFILKHLELMALHKLNVFHWHLTEDQGWRIEIRKYPRLTQVGAFRSESQLGKDPARGDGLPHGGFYTQEDVREVVRFAAERFITVVPEIEMPGHAQAILAAYPELGNTGLPVTVWTRWGVSNRVLNVEESTISFLFDVLTEITELFPSPFIHVGGDEVPPAEWLASERALSRMREVGARSPEELHAWLNGRINAFLASRGRRLVGWDEILEGGLVPGAVVMSWRGTDGGRAAALAGHDVVMAPTSHTYLDYYQSRDPSEPVAIGGFLPLETVYAFEPVPEDLDESAGRCVLGAQAQLWTEYLKTPAEVEYMAWPRLAALAEVVWSPREARNLDDFLARLRLHVSRLDALGIRHGRIPSGSGDLP